MARRTDSRQRMIAAANRLFQGHGYHGTALVDVVEAGNASRGSIYFHFPGGKEEIGVEVAIDHGAFAVTAVNRAASRSTTAAELIFVLIDDFATAIAQGSFAFGCPLTAMVADMSGHSEPIRAATRRAFDDWHAALAARLAETGLTAEDSRAIAGLTVSAIEGAIILCRVQHSRAPLDDASRQITTLAAAYASGHLSSPAPPSPTPRRRAKSRPVC